MSRFLNLLLTFVSVLVVCTVVGGVIALALKAAEPPPLFVPSVQNPKLTFGPSLVELVIAFGQNPADAVELVDDAAQPTVTSGSPLDSLRWVRAQKSDDTFHLKGTE